MDDLQKPLPYGRGADESGFRGGLQGESALILYKTKFRCRDA